MIHERAADCGAIYDEERRSLLALVGGLDAAELRTPVPASPAWSVQDVVAHVVGIATSLNAGDLGGGRTSDEWTEQQVTSRRGRSVAELAAEWDAEAPTFVEGLRLFGYAVGSHFVGDLVQHVADVHHALGRPRRPDDDDAVGVALDFYLDSFHDSLCEAGLAVSVTSGDHSWALGQGPVVATLTAPAFELLRALGGRRSEAQLRDLAWTGDVEAVVPLVSRYGVPAADLREP